MVDFKLWLQKRPPPKKKKKKKKTCMSYEGGDIAFFQIIVFS